MMIMDKKDYSIVILECDNIDYSDTTVILSDDELFADDNTELIKNIDTYCNGSEWFLYYSGIDAMYLTPDDKRKTLRWHRV